MRWLPWAMALLLIGCNPWKIRYEPRAAAAEAAPSVRKATRFVPLESKALAGAGGKALGALDVEGSSMVVERGEDLHQKARLEAASHGGTHFLLLDPHLSAADLAQVNEAFGISLKPGDLVASGHRALYLVVAVPREGWISLSTELQPVP